MSIIELISRFQQKKITKIKIEKNNEKEKPKKEEQCCKEDPNSGDSVIKNVDGWGVN